MPGQPCVLPQHPAPAVCECPAEHTGRLGRVRLLSPRSQPCSPAPPPPPHLQIGLVSVPHPWATFLGSVPAHGQGSHQQGQCRVNESVFGVYQQPHTLRPGMLRGRGQDVRANGVLKWWGARAPTSYLCHSVQAAEGGLQVLILFRTEVGELEVLGGTREWETAQDYRLLWDRVLSPTRKGHA